MKYTKAIFGETPAVAFVLSGETNDFADDFKALKDTDGYAVRKLGDSIVFVADCPRGHANGVHRWLEKNSDIIWPRPKNDLCFFSKSNNRTIEQWNHDYLDVPAFRTRFFGGGSSDEEVKRYLSRNAVFPVGSAEGYFEMYGGGHDMEMRWFPRKEFFKDHPEYWMLIDGERWTGERSNFCETNPEFVKAYAKSVEAKIRGLPKTLKYISINMEDTGLTCQCENCMKPIRLADSSVVTPDDPAFRSTRFFIFFNEVAKHVAKVRPELKIFQFAYMHLAVPPKVKIERNVILKFCPYPRNMRESVIEGPTNEKWRKRIDEWLANTPEMYWREYYFCQCIYYPRPISDTAATDLRYIWDRGVKYVYTDSAGGRGDNEKNNPLYGLNRPNREYYDLNGIEAWCVQKLLWDPSLDPKKLREEFIRRSFGPAAPDVAEFYKLLNDSWYSDELASGFSDNPVRSTAHYVVEKGIAGKSRAALEKALAKADNADRREWLSGMLKAFDEWVADAPNYMSAELKIPFAKDLGGAIKLPKLRMLKNPKISDGSGTTVKAYSDGRAFVVVTDVVKGKVPLYAQKGLPTGVFPRGDKVELMFATGKSGYTHLAFDPNGHQYTGKKCKGTADAKECPWKVNVEKTASGWRSVALVPFDLIDFAPHIDPSLRFNILVSFNDGGEKARNRNYVLGSGLPHAPASWNQVKIDIE